MKNFTLFLTIFTCTTIYANSGIYIGVGASKVNETLQPYLSTPKTTVPNLEISAKIGYGSRTAYAAELSLDYVQNNSKYFANGDAQKIGFNISLIKAYDFGIYVSPYLKVGFGAGALQTNADTTNKSLTYGNFHAGTGLFIPLIKHLDLEVAYQYRYLTYERINRQVQSYPKSHINGIYTGLNIRF